MAEIKAFRAFRPRADLAPSIAALPYDVYSEKEARLAVSDAPLSFLRIDRAETQFPPGTDPYSAAVYRKAHETLQQMIDDGLFIQDSSPCLYLYELSAGSHTQTGLVACTSLDDFLNGTVKKHETTRAEKELDRIRHVDICNAQTGPIFLAYRCDPDIRKITERIKKQDPVFSFISEDRVSHRGFLISSADDISLLTEKFSTINNLYIADGHHRAASAVKAGLKRRKESSSHTGEEGFNSILSVLFPDNELQILSYNRMVTGFNGYTQAELRTRLDSQFQCTPCPAPADAPRERHTIFMYINRNWYRLKARPFILSNDPAAGLDAAILQEHILHPVLGIADPKTDPRIRFVGGIHNLRTLAAKTDALDEGIAFALPPVSIRELFLVADAGLLMPPKSTWFEPKLRSGLFIHQL